MVDILMATYNGEAYVRQQILSIMAQTHTDWRLVIHDDGSTDSTVKTIKSLLGNDPRILLVEDGRRYGNAAANFMALLKYAESPFIMFCDQDDIWFDNKVETMLAAIRRCPVDIPSAVFSQSYFWVPERGIEGKTMFHTARSVKEFIFSNGAIQGCASIFNNTAKECLLRLDYTPVMHDLALQTICLSLGKVEYLEIPLMLYRRHLGTVTTGIGTRAKRLSEAMRSNEIGVVAEQIYKDWANFRRLFGENLRSEDNEAIGCYLEMPRKGKIKIIYRIVRHGFSLFGSRARLLLKVCLRPYMTEF